MVRLILLLLFFPFIAGCGWVNSFFLGTDNSIPPAKLLNIAQPLTIRKLWDTRVGSGTDGNFIKLKPAINDGRLYAASHNGVVMALDVANGETLWKVDTGLAISAGVGVGSGLVLVGTGKGEVLAMDQNKGNEVWHAQMSSEILSSPGVGGGVVVVRSVDGKFAGFDARSGQRLWTYSYTVPALTLRGAAAPLVDQKVAVSGLETGKLLVLSLADGKLIWERAIAPPHGRTELERLVDIDSEPRVVDDALYVAAYQGNITAINLHNGNTLWSRDFSNHTGLDADADRIYIADEADAVWALDRRTGGELWKQAELNGRHLSAPAVNDAYVVVGDFEGYLHWLSKDNGKVVGRIRADSSGIVNTPIMHGDVLYVLSQGGTLSAYQAGSG